MQATNHKPNIINQHASTERALLVGEENSPASFLAQSLPFLAAKATKNLLPNPDAGAGKLSLLQA